MHPNLILVDLFSEQHLEMVETESRSTYLRGPGMYSPFAYSLVSIMGKRSRKYYYTARPCKKHILIVAHLINP